jgi:hypothetical protein
MLWAGILAGPAAWATDLVASYAVVQWTCRHQRYDVLHLVTVAAVAVTLAGALAAWRALQQSSADRPRFMGVLGLSMSAFFVLVIVAEAIPRWVLNACH